MAQVKVGQYPPRGLVGQDEDDDIGNGIVVMRKGENPSKVLAGVQDKINLLNRRGLPPGKKIIPYYDRSWLIKKMLHTVFANLTEGALLVMLLFVFLQNLRAAAIVAVVIPLSLLATFLGLTFVGILANLLSFVANGLRHHRRRCGDRGREHLPPPWAS